MARDVARVVLQAIKEYDAAARAGPQPNGTGLTKSRSSSAPGAAYRRGDALEKRRGLMDEWAMFCGSVKTGVGRAA
jgi:hypothetical protein